jgi:phage baseplate assembly protein W
MAEGISPKLPLAMDGDDGAYGLNKTYKETAKQNLKHLILTVPGEHMMDPELGVGLRRFLFEPNIEVVHEKIEQRIKTQVAKYLPFIQIITITMVHPDNSRELDPAYVGIILQYIITPLGGSINEDIILVD